VVLSIRCETQFTPVGWFSANSRKADSPVSATVVSAAMGRSSLKTLIRRWSMNPPLSERKENWPRDISRETD